MNQLNFNEQNFGNSFDFAASNPAEALQFMQALTASKTDEAVPILIAAFRHPDPLVAAVAIDKLIELAPHSVEPLIAQFSVSLDHELQAYIVQALARMGDPRSLDVLTEVVGVAIANHCQGNVRRVAARGLGQIATRSNDPNLIRQCVDKLIWVLRNPEDWALRYGAVVSLQEIGTEAAIAALKQGLVDEGDPVVQVRIQRAIASLEKAQKTKKSAFRPS